MALQTHAWPNGYLNDAVSLKGPEETAKLIGVSRAAVYYWLRAGWVPDMRVAEVVKKLELPNDSYTKLCRPAMRATWRELTRKVTT